MEGRRSKEALRNSIQSYGVKVMDPATMPLKKNSITEFQKDVDLHSQKFMPSENKKKKGLFKCCKFRVPYPTILATVICGLGVVISLVSWNRSENVTEIMITESLRINATGIAAYEAGFTILNCVTGGVGVMILIVGFLATGDTRSSAYKNWKARVGGRICCAVLMIVTLSLLPIWAMIFYFSGYFVLMSLESKSLCSLHFREKSPKSCVELPLMNIIFHNEGGVRVCGPQQIKLLCKDFVENSFGSYFLMTIGTFLILTGLVLYLICLSANYAKIRSEGKFREIRELHGLEEDLNRKEKKKNEKEKEQRKPEENPAHIGI